MGKNLVRKDFLNDGSWVCPGGVKRVRVMVTAKIYNLLSSAMSISNDLNMYCQGNILGNGSSGSVSSPVLVVGNRLWRSGGSSGGIDTNGVVCLWGSNAKGQLGDNTNTDRSSPTPVVSTRKFRQVSQGGQIAAAIDVNGDLYTWGLADRGQLGTGDLTSRSTPIAVAGTRKWRQIACGGSHMVAIDSLGDMYAWGENNKGQLGNGDTVARSSPTLVAGGRKWLYCTGGSTASYGIVAPDSSGVGPPGDAYSWGENTDGQLGLNDNLARSSPVLLLGSKKWLQLTAGQYTAGGLDQNHDAYTWGRNINGELGTGNVTPVSSPVLVVGGRKWMQFRQGEAGYAIDNTGLQYAWGRNTAGNLGVGDQLPRSSPVLVLGPQRYLTSYNALANEVLIDVIPGTTYDVLVFGITALFGYTGIYQDPTNFGALPIQITLEYEA